MEKTSGEDQDPPSFGAPYHCYGGYGSSYAPEYFLKNRLAKGFDEIPNFVIFLRHRHFITNDDPNIEQKRCAAFHSRRKSISGDSPTSFPENTSMPYSGFEPELIRLQTECHNHHTKQGRLTTL
ncbi:hypothetical protein TNCV_622371 [Trichonephila clavipes]|nr:hypothetical protein TNCV_622371 [Trichonephila clavipes]